MQNYKLLIAPLIAWFVAQGVKFVITLRKDGFQIKDLYASGDFPSSHTAMITSFTALYGLEFGFDQPLFAAMAVVSALFMYDAVGVRRSVGEQAQAIREIEKKLKIKLNTRAHQSKGHTPVEVMGGFVIGVLIAITLNGIT